MATTRKAGPKGSASSTKAAPAGVDSGAKPPLEDPDELHRRAVAAVRREMGVDPDKANSFERNLLQARDSLVTTWAQRFRREGDVMAGLRAAHEQLLNKEPLPRRVAEWLSNGIANYLCGRSKTLDEALGLNKPGKSNPRRKERDKNTLSEALRSMYELQVLGAAIPNAAALVASVSPGHSASTLEARYRRGGISKDALALRREKFNFPRELGVWWFAPERVLARFPDAPLELAQAKDAIRAAYAKAAAMHAKAQGLKT